MKGSKLLLGGLGLLAARGLLGDRSDSSGGVPEVQKARGAVDGIVARVRPAAAGLLRELDLWPVSPVSVTSLGDTTGARKGEHQGLDIHVPAGTPVVAPEAVVVRQVKDGTRAAVKSPSWKAGMFVDAEGTGGRVLRFLHLDRGSVRVREGDRLQPGDAIGLVTHKGDAGMLDSEPHLHFEVRGPSTQPHQYGSVLNPADVLPLVGPSALQLQLRAKRSSRGRASVA